MKVFVDANPTNYAVVDENGDLALSGKFEKPVTNNEAEYYAVIRGLEVDGVTEILSDSQLVVNQLNMNYHIREDRLRELAKIVWKRAKAKGKIKFTWIPRKENKAGKVLG